MKLGKLAFNCDAYIYLCLLYIPPKVKSVCPENDDIFESLTICINDYSTKGKLILMGDFIARTGSANDHVELDEITELDYDLLTSNYLADINPPTVKILIK